MKKPVVKLNPHKSDGVTRRGRGTRDKVSRKELLAAMDYVEQVVSDDFCCEMEMRFAFHGEELSLREKQMWEKISLAYKILHSWNPTYSCHNSHDDWRKLVTHHEVEPEP